jgi:hypothetical protein
MLSFVLIASIVASVAAQTPQCGGDFQQSSVVDPTGRTLFSINRSTGKTVIADLDSPALTAALAKLDAMQGEIDRLKAALSGAPPAPAPAPSPSPSPAPVPAAGSQTQFTIWGTNICPSPLSTRTYDGYIVGGASVHNGSGSNPLCLPFATQGNLLKTAMSTGSRALVYPAEFNTIGGGTTANPILRSVDNSEMRCASCVASTRIVEMIPGRAACFAGWTALYSGWLMSTSYASVGRSQFICVVDTTQIFGRTTQAGVLSFAIAELRVDTAIFAPEITEDVDDADLACVVCAKNN